MKSKKISLCLLSMWGILTYTKQLNPSWKESSYQQQLPQVGSWKNPSVSTPTQPALPVKPIEPRPEAPKTVIAPPTPQWNQITLPNAFVAPKTSVLLANNVRRNAPTNRYDFTLEGSATSYSLQFPIYEQNMKSWFEVDKECSTKMGHTVYGSPQ